VTGHRCVAIHWPGTQTKQTKQKVSVPPCNTIQYPYNTHTTPIQHPYNTHTTPIQHHTTPYNTIQHHTTNTIQPTPTPQSGHFKETKVFTHNASGCFQGLFQSIGLNISIVHQFTHSPQSFSFFQSQQQFLPHSNIGHFQPSIVQFLVKVGRHLNKMMVNGMSVACQ
jgi:hypothetical protein